MSKFKVGDKVYFPKNGGSVFVVDWSNNPILQFKVDDSPLTGVGNIHIGDIGSAIFHATGENHAALSTLFPEIEFELPPLANNEIVQQMLKDGKPVMCYLSDDSYDMAVFRGIYGLVSSYDADEGFDAGGSCWQYVVPMKYSDVMSKIGFIQENQGA